MAVPLNISIEQLAEALNSLSQPERDMLISLLDEKWNESNEVNLSLQDLLVKSQRQHRLGKSKLAENIIKESKEKYGL